MRGEVFPNVKAPPGRPFGCLRLRNSSPSASFEWAVATQHDGGRSTWRSEALFPSSTRFRACTTPRLPVRQKGGAPCQPAHGETEQTDRKSTRLNSSHLG